jgi:hypothetical protein
MSRHEKLVARLLSRPRDFEWKELKLVMAAFGYELRTTGGSGRKFIGTQSQAVLFMHEPHPSKILKAYQVNAAIDFLKQEKHIQ